MPYIRTDAHTPGQAHNTHSNAQVQLERLSCWQLQAAEENPSCEKQPTDNNLLTQELPVDPLTLPQAAGHIEGHLQGLLCVKAGVTVCVVAGLQVVFTDLAAATNTLSHIVACAAADRAGGWVGVPTGTA
jgi:hypothetical protein